MGAGCSSDTSVPSASIPSQTRQGDLSWRQVLDRVAEEDLWAGVKREDRAEWSAYFTQVDKILSEPRRPLPEDTTSVIINGDVGLCELKNLPTAQPKVIVFVSSTFTDTKAERNLLMRDVYPYLRSLCRRLGMDFGTADMRWGIREEATLEHSTVSMCIKEIERCIKESAGPAFLCILGHKYGYRPVPAEIEQTEFEPMLQYLENNNHDTKLLKEYFRLDNNAVPPEYVLRPRTAEDTDWWDTMDKITPQLRLASSSCFGDDLDRLEKYNISVTHTEINVGAYDNPAKRQQTTFVKRELSDVTSEKHLDRRLIDMAGDVIDQDAQKKLEQLKNVELVENMLKDIVLEFDFQISDVKACEEYIRGICDQVCRKFADQILKNYEEFLHTEEDEVFQEAMQHRQLALDKCSLFVGREVELGKIINYAQALGTGDNVLSIHGRSGCGKTALLAMGAKQAKEAIPQSVLILRFLGTTSFSGSARSLLFNICSQITRAYAKDVSLIPGSYKELISYFKVCLSYASSSCPLLIFLDSLDQLSNEDFGRNLAWLPLKDHLPPHVKIVVSSIPSECLDVLQTFLTESHCFEILPLKLQQGPEILGKMLAQKNRKITKEQEEIVIQAFSKCPLPLFLRLASDIAMRWHSYDVIGADAIAEDMPGLISALFRRLETRYGEVFVKRTLGYITAAKQGLSVTELEDVLSCDDVVLDSVFEWWTPPFRRIPPLLWARVRSELGVYLVERGVDGVSAYNWYHRQFWETAVARYLDGSESFRTDAHESIMNYFDGKWENGVMYTRKLKDGSFGAPVLEPRQVPKQPIVLSGVRGAQRQLNRRKLNELPYHLIKLQMWDKLIHLFRDLEFLEAKFEAGFGYQCLSELREATAQSGIHPDLQHLTRFVGANLAFLLREPEAVYQVTSQLPLSSPMRSTMDNVPHENFPKALLVDTDTKDFNDPCEITLSGHTASVRSCDYSPKGDIIISTADDRTLRIWDTVTGAELITITDLPETIFPKKGDAQPLKLHAANPCCFAPSGEIIGNGSEAGEIILWDTRGRQIHKEKEDAGEVSYVCFSPSEDLLLATTFRNGHVCLWYGQELRKVFSDETGSYTTCAAFSTDGTMLAVTPITGLMLYDTSDVNNVSLLSRARGQTNLHLSCAFHPTGAMAVTGGDDSAISVWDIRDRQSIGVSKKRVNFHRAWIWSTKFTKCGTYLFTTSSDRSIKMWQCNGPILPGDSWEVIKTLGGHSHRVCIVSLRPGKEDKIVTSSLDTSLKLWDIETIKTGTLPPTGSLHYHLSVATPAGNYLTTVVGWSCWCNIIDVSTRKYVAKTPQHTGFLSRAEYSADGRILLTLDTGHKGDYREGAAREAHVYVSSVPDGQLIVALGVSGPTFFSRGKDLVVVGTMDGNVHVFAMHDFQEIRQWRCGSQVITTVACSPDDAHVLVTFGKEGRVCHVKDGSTVSDLPDITSRTYQSQYSVQGHRLVVGTDSGKMLVWSVPQYQLLHVLTKHTYYVKDLQFSPSGRHLVSSADLSVRVWDVEDGFNLKAVYFCPVNCATFIGDNIVVAGDSSGMLRYLKF